MASPRDFRRVFDNLATAVLVFDADLCLRDINSAGEALLSLSKRKARGLHMHSLVRAPALDAVVRRACKAQAPVIERDLHVDAGEGDLAVDCAVTPIFEDDGLSEVLIELSSVERLQRMVRDESLVAQHSMATALLRGMAHEIKNPLGGIRGAAQLLERELRGSPQTEYTRIIVQEVDRLRTLIDRMMEPAVPAAPQKLNIHEVLEHVRGLVQAENQGALKIEVDYDPSLPDITAIRDHLVQVALNLLRNAVEAAGRDGHYLIRTRVQRLAVVGGRLHRLALRVDICDDGPGVPEQIAQRIFYPMVSGRPSGTGLGLAIAQSLVQRNGGFIEFESRPGSTTFTILLPIENG
ncbi:MAG: nitrogen regulation protein NR(II) [Gammaproteobacteria bacterium]